MTPVRFLIVRHGHVEGIDPFRFRGRRDLPLTETGKAQARAVARRIAATVHVDAIYASPLSRTLVTAQTIARPLSLDVRVCEELIDIDYGRWHGLTIEEARETSPTELELWLNAPQLALIPDGETLPAVTARAARAVGEIGRRHEGQTVCLVAHDTINRVMLAHALDLGLSHYWCLDQSPCCINELVLSGSSFRIVRMNDTAHLEG